MTAAGYAGGAGYEAQRGARPLYAQRRTPVPLVAMAVGCTVLTVGLFLTVAGIPGKLFFHARTAHVQPPGSLDTLGNIKAIDSNIRYIGQGTSKGPNDYNGHIDAVDAEEIAIPKLAAQLDTVNGSVIGLDRELAAVQQTTQQLQGNMAAMVATSKHSGATMDQLGTQIQTLSGTMAQLDAATLQLSGSMQAIDVKAAAIATHGTGKARTLTGELNSALPPSVPKPTTSLDASTGAGAQ